MVICFKRKQNTPRGAKDRAERSKLIQTELVQESIADQSKQSETLSEKYELSSMKSGLVRSERKDYIKLKQSEGK